MRIIILATILLTGLSRLGYSCDCDGERKPINDLLKSAKHVVIGTIKSSRQLSKTSGNGQVEYFREIEFDVLEIFAGDSVRTIIIQNEDTSCGQTFEQGKKYLLYVFQDKKTASLFVHQCYSHCPDIVSQFGKDDLIEIRKLVSAKK